MYTHWGYIEFGGLEVVETFPIHRGSGRDPIEGSDAMQVKVTVFGNLSQESCNPSG